MTLTHAHAHPTRPIPLHAVRWHPTPLAIRLGAALAAAAATLAWLGTDTPPAQALALASAAGAAITIILAQRITLRRVGTLIDIMNRMADRSPVALIPSLSDRDTVGDMARALAVFRADAEEITIQSAELEDIRRQYGTALNHMKQGLMVLDADLRVVMCNQPMRTMFNHDPDIVRPGASMAQVLDHCVAQGNHPGMTSAALLADLTARAATGRASSYRCRISGDRQIAVHWEPVADGGWVTTYEDITAVETATAQVVYLAHHDPVTGLPNRAGLQDALAAHLQPYQQRHFNLLCLIVDRFETLCDTRGHRTGDLLLQEVTKRLRDGVRACDIVTRLGGGAFAVLQSGIATHAAAAGLAERLTSALKHPLEIDGLPAMTTVSIGIAGPLGISPGAHPTEAAAEVLRNATMAAHRARIDGGGTWHFYAPDMDHIAQARDALETDLRQALDRGQFVLHYQPLVDVALQRVTSFEALLRWQHPSRGMVSPADFIPLAEELGLIGDIGAWVLHTACTEAATWPNEVGVAVNLSPLQFGQPAASLSLPDIVRAALAESGLSGHRLELEITESVRLQDDRDTLATLHQLRGLGVRIALDDFGTGYSSLSYLRCFPFDRLKIDQSFIRSLPAPDSLAIVRAVCALGTSLGIAVIAEGIETEAQMRALLAEHCHEMQGYLFSPPRPAADVPALIQTVAITAAPCLTTTAAPCLAPPAAPSMAA